MKVRHTLNLCYDFLDKGKLMVGFLRPTEEEISELMIGKGREEEGESTISDEGVRTKKAAAPLSFQDKAALKDMCCVLDDFLYVGGQQESESSLITGPCLTQV